MHIAQLRVVAGFAEAGMKWNDDAELLRPRQGEVESVPGAGTVEEHQRLTAARGEHGGLHAIDRVRLAFESGQGVRAGHERFSLLTRAFSFPLYAAATRRSLAARARMRGMTSCPRLVRFFTTFQCGILPMAPRMLKWLVPSRSPHSSSCPTT